MKIQSLSIHVPTKGCVNNCEFCVSRMHESPFEDRIGQVYNDKDELTFASDSKDFITEEYERRILFCKENGVNTVILTGDGEALQNRKFLEYFGKQNKKWGFRWVELQTSGVLLFKAGVNNALDYSNLQFLREEVGVSTISMSISDLFDDENNYNIQNTPEILRFPIDMICRRIKDHNFNLRISLNLSSAFNQYNPLDIFYRLKQLGADQVTFRKLYTSPSGNGDIPQNVWIKNNPYDEEMFKTFQDAVKKEGKFLGILPFGAAKYSIQGISTVVDDNCMDNAHERPEPDVYKYLILRPNCKLYSSWDDQGSLIF